VILRGSIEANGSLSAPRWFRKVRDGEWLLRNTFLGDPYRRQELVEELLRTIKSKPRGTPDDPSLKAMLTAECQRLKQIVDDSLTTSERKAARKGIKRSLYAYQRQGVDRFLVTGRLLLADDMGLGKTAQAIAACHMLWHAARIRRGLLIVPAALKPQWAREWGMFTDLSITVIDGSPPERHAYYRLHKEGLFIINYEQLLRDLDVVRKWEPDLVVLDEAQRIKNWATKTALSVKGLAPRYRLVLTGTPMENRIEELASVVEWVDDMALEPKWRLGAVHATRADGKRGITGVRNLDTLRERLKPCMVRRVRREVLDQLPPRTDTRVPVDMTEEQVEEHDSLIQPIRSILERTEHRALTQGEFLRLMTLLTTQRIISNGIAQLRFESVWPSVQKSPPEESVIKGSLPQSCWSCVNWSASSLSNRAGRSLSSASGGGC
jgi:SNF2 family DNA or RNA helicase